MRGRKPKPTELRVLEGNRGKVRINTIEPKFQSAATVPAPPDWIGDGGKAEWNRLASELHGQSMLTQADLGPFTMLCYYWGQFVVAAKNLSLIGDPKEYKSAVVEINSYMDRYLKLSVEFGFTPSSRTRIRGKDLEGQDTFARYMAKREAAKAKHG